MVDFFCFVIQMLNGNNALLSICLFLNEVMNAKYGIHVSPNNKTLAVTNK